MNTTTIGYDNGNGTNKLVIDGAKQAPIPSYTLDAPSGLTLPSSGYVRYITGDSLALSQRGPWLTGAIAAEQSPRGYSSVSGDKHAKVERALQMLLGALSLCNPRSQDIDLVCSINLMAKAEAVKAALEGTHTVRFNQALEDSTITIRVLRVVPEGYGAVIGYGLTQGTNVIFDLGNGDTTATVYGANGRPVRSHVKPAGVEQLISNIARDGAFIDLEGEQGNPAVIRAAIEAGTFTYGKRSGFSFENIYKRCLNEWAPTAIQGAITAAKDDLVSADRVVAIGGGCKLPLMGGFLARRNIEQVQNPVYASAQGLYDYACLLRANAR